MRQKVWSYLMALCLLTGFAACTNEDPVNKEGTSEGTTYLGLSIAIPKQAGLRASDDNNYNSVGIYSGATFILTLDLYLISSDGTTLLDSHRFIGKDDLLVGSNADQSDLITLKEPYKTTPGDKQLVIIINSPQALQATVIDTTYSFSIGSGSGLTLSQLAHVDNTRQLDLTSTLSVGADILVLTGKTGVFTIEDGISAQEVTKNGKNTQLVNITRIPSRAIVTTTASLTVTDTTTSTVLGTISDLTYSIAQGANTVYYFPRTDGGSPATTVSWGYQYMPGPSTDYSSTASTYYDYSDLQNLNDTIPNKSANGDGWYYTLPGKFLLENTHPTGADLSTTRYRKGNTAYALIRAIFKPNPAIVKGGALSADGTFYVGGSDGNVYSSIAAAQDYDIGLQNQPVFTYTGGKVLYYVWLNPDDIQKPINSPVIRNNIYHINISAIRSIGLNWNPLVPPVIKNPDPQPNGPEPPSPIVPTDPLSSTDTYMSVDVTIVPWTIHTYEIDL
ncbi:hypothetical protein FACS1894182_03530 [Bacteroidia bacterium]|nr:hypothetical protein FACS1894182_03530 [Bacteroidia bacterium]